MELFTYMKTINFMVNVGKLVGGFNPSEKYYSQFGSFRQVGMKIKNIWNHHPVNIPYIEYMGFFHQICDQGVQKFQV